MSELEDSSDLQLKSTIGFEGSIVSGVHVHPDGENLVYAVGTHVVARRLAASTSQQQQQRLIGRHTHSISCLALSRSGKYIASGQQNYMGFKAGVSVWSYSEGRYVGGHSLHKVKVVSIGISANDKYVGSLGGQDDGSVVVFDIEAGSVLCGVTASLVTQGNCRVLAFGCVNDELLVTAGDYVLRVWKIMHQQAAMTPFNLAKAGVKRKIRCMTVDGDDEVVYCGTTSGDVLIVRLGFSQRQSPCLVASCARRPAVISRRNSEGLLFPMGVWSILLRESGHMILGTGDGHVYSVKRSTVKPQTAIRLLKCPTNQLLDVESVVPVSGRVTTLARLPGDKLLAATMLCQLYIGDLSVRNLYLHLTGHPSEVKQVVFPRSCSEVFVTCSAEDIRVWHTATGRELLRMSVPNFICQCVCLTEDDTTIVSGWNDGIIRAFCAETGALKYTIRDAHNRGVTAVVTLNNGQTLVSGGDEGHVRIWSVDRDSGVSRLLTSFNEHRKSVLCLCVTSDGGEFVSASTDGSCVVWNMRSHRRKVALFANCSFMGACYGWGECQLITCGTDKKLAYWEVYDGSLVRSIDASSDGPLNTLDISADDNFIVTGGHDKTVKVFRYKEGDCLVTGRGHSSPISALRISPDSRVIVSAGDDGSILIWQSPSQMLAQK